MQQNPPPDRHPEDVCRAEHALENISTRIARLSMSLGASLEADDQVDKIMRRELPFFAEHPAFSAAQWPLNSDARLAHEWEELRGLLLLRCDLMLHLLKNHDLETALTVASEVETHMQLEGFKPGVNGFDWNRFLTG